MLVAQDGYMLHDRVVRPAQVIVSHVPPRRNFRANSCGTFPAANQLRPLQDTSSMPTYDYLCDACGHKFELFQWMNDDAE